MRTLLFCCWLALAFPVAGAEINLDFGSYSGDQTLTNDFQSALAGGGRPGKWQVVMDEVPSAFAPLSSNAPAYNLTPVLAQLDTDPTDTRFPMLIYEKETLKDFQLTTQFKIISGVVEQMAGIVFKYQNESNYYVVRVSALGHNLRFYKYINGQFVDPQTLAMDITPGVWHSLAIDCEGDQINCWYDQHVVAQMQTPEAFPAGKVGFWTMADSVTHFGDTSITYTPVVPMAQLLIQHTLEQEPRVLGLRIYTLDKSGKPHVIASKVPAEVGNAGTDAEEKAINNGATFFGRGKGTVAVTMPLNDRNGNPVAAVRVQLKSFLGETQDTAILRARMVIQLMQAQVLSSQDLLQ